MHVAHDERCTSRWRPGSYRERVAENFAALRELCVFLRSQHVQSLRVGELELRFEPSPVAPPVPLALPSPIPFDEKDSEDAERRSLEELLHSSGGDADAILRAMRGASGRAA